MSTVDDLPDRVEFLQGTLDLLVLKCLQEGANHAYGISKVLEAQSDRAFVVDNGSLYPALQRLLQQGLVKAEWKKTPNGRRARYYRLTSAGRDRFDVERARWAKFTEAMDRVLAPEG